VSDTPAALTREHVHALSNHLAVILGFVELLLAETPEGTQQQSDLREIRAAALEAARMIGHRPPPEEPGDTSE
jgi:hypothetical protein